MGYIMYRLQQWSWDEDLTTSFVQRILSCARNFFWRLYLARSRDKDLSCLIFEEHAKLRPLAMVFSAKRSRVRQALFLVFLSDRNGMVYMSSSILDWKPILQVSTLIYHMTVYFSIVIFCSSVSKFSSFLFKGWLNARPPMEGDVLMPLFEKVFSDLRLFVQQSLVPKMEVSLVSLLHYWEQAFFAVAIRVSGLLSERMLKAWVRINIDKFLFLLYSYWNVIMLCKRSISCKVWFPGRTLLNKLTQLFLRNFSCFP